MLKKLLIVTNLITLTILVAFAYKIRTTVQPVHTFDLPKTSLTLKIPCEYQLKYFDFHYRKESTNPKIIMLGNSLIRHGRWDSILNRTDVINRGISGDRLGCICERLSYLKNINARICFIEGGINDLPGGNLDTLFKEFKDICNFWLQEKIIPVINLVLYISPKAGITFPSRLNYKSINIQVKQLNDKLVFWANENNIDYIDMNEILSNQEELILKDEYTTDGVHLTKVGYQEWANRIKKILTKYQL